MSGITVAAFKNYFLFLKNLLLKGFFYQFSLPIGEFPVINMLVLTYYCCTLSHNVIVLVGKCNKKGFRVGVAISKRYSFKPAVRKPLHPFCPRNFQNTFYLFKR